MDRSLKIVSQLVAQMTGASEFSAGQRYERLLAQLVTQFAADDAFLRHDNHTLRVSRLIAEWPPRDPALNPDPTARSPFVENDVVLAGDLQSPVVVAVEGSWLSRYRGPTSDDGEAPVMAVAPLRWGSVTTGVIGLTRAPGSRWSDDELDALGVIGGLFAQFQARIATESRLRGLAERDQLTDLHNRRALIAEIRRRMRVGRPGPVAALYVDLDRLKTVNDHLGHAAGDVIIRTCAQRLTAHAGRHAMVARVGGDEFVVIPGAPMPADAAEALARRLQAAMSGPVRVCGDLITRTVSVGVAVGMPGIDTGDDLLHRADHAALGVKRNGGNAVAVCGAERLTSVLSRVAPEFDIGRAVELQYQPEIDMRTGEIVAVEALAHSQPIRALPPHAGEATVEPMPWSSRSDRLVVRRACGDLSRWRSHGVGHNVTMCLNVSAAQLAADGFAASVSSAIDEFGIDPVAIRLEVCEQVVARDIQKAQITLATLKDIGVGIAIDDYGCGDIALLQLKKLPVDALKIKSGFTRGLGRGGVDLAVVRAIIGVADDVGLELTALGVETSAAADALLQHGCHRAQGPLLARPVGSDVMESLLSRRRVPPPQPATDEPAFAVRSVAS